MRLLIDLERPGQMSLVVYVIVTHRDSGENRRLCNESENWNNLTQIKYYQKGFDKKS